MINKNKGLVSSKEAISLVIIFILGTALILIVTLDSKQDIWISVIMATFAIIPMLYVYSKILSFFPGENIFQIVEKSCGRIVGKVFSVLFILYFLYVAALSLRSITEFIQVVYFRQTPQIFSGLWIVLVACYLVKCGIEVLGRWANMVCVILLVLIFLVTIISIKHIDIENNLPILYNGWGPVIRSASYIYFFPFGELVVFLALFNKLEQPKKTFKILSLATIIGGFVILTVTVRSVFILGTPLVDKSYFPTYYASTTITVGGIIESAGIFSSIILLLAGFAKFATFLFAASIGLKHIFKAKDYSRFSLPMALLALIISQLVFKNTMEMMENVEVYPYQAIAFQMILPLIILLFAWLKKKKA